MLKPVCVAKDPTRAGSHYLVLCEVFNADGGKHVSNARGDLRSVLSGDADGADAWIGFEQEYTLMRDGRPLGFPKDGFPALPGSYYCSVGADRAFGRGAFTFGVSFLSWMVLKATMGLRLHSNAEDIGADMSEVGMRAYHFDFADSPIGALPQKKGA